MNEDMRGRSDGQLYWAIENGIAFSAMGEYGTRMDSDEIWSVVAYIRSFQDGTAQAVPEITPTPNPDGSRSR